MESEENRGQGLKLGAPQQLAAHPSPPCHPLCPHVVLPGQALHMPLLQQGPRVPTPPPTPPTQDHARGTRQPSPHPTPPVPSCAGGGHAAAGDSPQCPLHSSILASRAGASSISQVGGPGEVGVTPRPPAHSHCREKPWLRLMPRSLTVRTCGGRGDILGYSLGRRELENAFS